MELNEVEGCLFLAGGWLGLNLERLMSGWSPESLPASDGFRDGELGFDWQAGRLVCWGRSLEESELEALLVSQSAPLAVPSHALSRR